MIRACALAALLSSAAAAQEQRGWSVQGLPLISYSTDEGIGYGARVQLIDHGAGEQKPYRYAITGQFFLTTKDIASHSLAVDAPAFLGSRNRFEVGFDWAYYRFFPYFGLGNTSVYHQPFDTCANRDALAGDPDHCPGNPEFRGLRYYRYNQETLPRIKLNVRRDLAGEWKLFTGYRFRRTRIAPLYGKGDLGQRDVSQMILDAQAGRLTGYDGSNPSASFVRRTAELTFGLVYDTRDNEPAPTQGMFHEASLRGAAHPLGSEFDYWGANLNLRAYQWLFWRDLVVAGRVLFDAAGGDVPFFLLGTTGGLGGPDGIGGDSSVRGLMAYRLQGKVKLLLNSELRWRFLSIPHFDFGVAGALDAGRVWSALGTAEGGPLMIGSAAGLRVAWNKNFVIRFDYGIGISEPYADGNVYLTFDEMF